MRGPIFDLFDFIAGKVSLEYVVISLFSIFVIIFVCTPVHECAHAAAAYWLGDDTAALQGRMTIYPLAHIDPLGTLCMLLCRYGWGKPVPVKLYRCRKVSMRTANVLVSIAGPLSNFLMALIFMIIYKIVGVAATPTDTMRYIVYGLYLITQINTYLMLFNLIPVPPLDGYSLLERVLPRKAGIWIEEHAQILRIIFVALVVSSVLSVPLSYASDGVMWVLDKMTFFIR